MITMNHAIKIRLLKSDNVAYIEQQTVNRRTMKNDGSSWQQSQKDYGRGPQLHWADMSVQSWVNMYVQ